MSIRIVLVDDHTVVLEGLRALLSTEPDLVVVELCNDGVEALQAVERHRPDVLVADAVMPGMSGVDLVHTLAERGLGIPVVILSASLDDQSLMQLLRMGVTGIVLKESASTELIDAIRLVHAGARSIPHALSERALDLFSKPLPDGGPLEGLTAREREVARAVISGLSNKRVSKQVGIAEGTVKIHLHNVFKKLGVSSRVQLLLVAQAQGWLSGNERGATPL